MKRSKHTHIQLSSPPEFEVGDIVVDITAEKHGWKNWWGVVEKIKDDSIAVGYPGDFHFWKVARNLRRPTAEEMEIIRL